MSSKPRVLVVGGGVIGVSCAYYLARKGARVRILERGRIAGEASYGNAGTVSAGHPPLNRPGRIRQAVRDMLDPKSPLYVPPRWDPGLWRWLWDFARACTDRQVARAMEVMAPMGHRTVELFRCLIEREEIDCGYRAEGYYDVCSTGRGLEAARAEAESTRPYGYRPEVLEPDEVRYREPALGGPLAGGVHYPESATVDPLRFVRGLADAFVRRGGAVAEGVEVVEVERVGARVTGVRMRDGSVEGADAVVLATGPFSLELARRAGLRIPVQPGKGYHRDVPVGPGGAPPLRTPCVLHESSVFCSPLEGRVRLAGTMEFSGLNHELRGSRLEQLTDAARTVFPAFGDAPPLSEWCGLRPVSVDGLPVVGELPGTEGLWIATGHGMLGLTLGPVTGELVAEGVLEGGLGSRAGAWLEAMSPGRFGRGWGWEVRRRVLGSCGLGRP